MKGAPPSRLDYRNGELPLSRNDRAPVWPLVALAIMLASLIGVTGCTSSQGVGASGVEDGEARIDDNVINLAVSKRLIDEGIGLFKDVKALVHRQRVLLIGTVSSDEDRERAGALAAGVDNVVEMMNEIQVSDENGIGAFISDVIIEKAIQSDYLFDDLIDSANFSVRSVNGTVFMIGHATNRAEYDQATTLASATNNVKRVVNYVVLDPP